MIVCMPVISKQFGPELHHQCIRTKVHWTKCNSFDAIVLNESPKLLRWMRIVMPKFICGKIFLNISPAAESAEQKGKPAKIRSRVGTEIDCQHFS